MITHKHKRRKVKRTTSLTAAKLPDKSECSSLFPLKATQTRLPKLDLHVRETTETADCLSTEVSPTSVLHSGISVGVLDGGEKSLAFMPETDVFQLAHKTARERPELARTVKPLLVYAILQSGMEQCRRSVYKQCFHPEEAVSAESGFAVWEGLVKHKISENDARELFGMRLSVPKDLIESFPPTLFVSKLIPQELHGAGSGGLLLPCSFISMLSENQATALKMMETKLAFRVDLQDCSLAVQPARDPLGNLVPLCVLHRTM